MPESVINDAVHGVMHFSENYKELIKTIIDVPNYQRLRHIKQLGMADLIFPTAVHTRFSHCLGAAYIASKMAIKMGLSESETKHAIVAALLHDIGHGAFSHVFEKIFDSEEKSRRISHEDWTDKFTSEYKNIPGNGVLKKEKIELDLISQFINHSYKKGGNNNIVADIVSSQLDADRLDYLLRDSHFCGVPYGNHNLEWIINNIERVDDVAGNPRLGIKLKAVQAVEHFLICRKLMTYSIYYHPKIIVLEYLIVEFLRKLAAICEDDKIRMNENLRNFLRKYHEFTIDKDKTKKNFIDGSFGWYSQIKDNDIWEVLSFFSSPEAKKISPGLSYISEVFANRKLPCTYKVRIGSEGKAKYLMEDLKKDKGCGKLNGYELLFISREFKAYKSDKDKIYVTENGNEFQIYSDIIRSISDQNKEYCVIAWDRRFNKKEMEKYFESVIDISTIF